MNIVVVCLFHKSFVKAFTKSKQKFNEWKNSFLFFKLIPNYTCRKLLELFTIHSINPRG